MNLCQLNTFSSLFGQFAVCAQQTGQKVRKKVFNWQRFICTEVTSYKIHILMKNIDKGLTVPKWAKNTPNAPKFICPNCLTKPKRLGFRIKLVSYLGVVALLGDCTFILADWGS